MWWGGREVPTGGREGGAVHVPRPALLAIRMDTNTTQHRAAVAALAVAMATVVLVVGPLGSLLVWLHSLRERSPLTVRLDQVDLGAGVVERYGSTVMSSKVGGKCMQMAEARVLIIAAGVAVFIMEEEVAGEEFDRRLLIIRTTWWRFRDTLMVDRVPITTMVDLAHLATIIIIIAAIKGHMSMEHVSAMLVMWALIVSLNARIVLHVVVKDRVPYLVRVCVIPDLLGARCESQCHRNTTCSGNGTCSACGGCICDACFHGNDCSQMCSGNGNCVGGQCQCDACHIGDFCESECNGHGTCGTGGTCVCDANWYGDKCTVKGCPTQTSDECSGHGLCNAYAGLCYCDPGWQGNFITVRHPLFMRI